MWQQIGVVVKYHTYSNREVSPFNFQGTDRRKGTEKQAVP